MNRVGDGANLIADGGDQRHQQVVAVPAVGEHRLDLGGAQLVADRGRHGEGLGLLGVGRRPVAGHPLGIDVHDEHRVGQHVLVARRPVHTGEQARPSRGHRLGLHRVQAEVEVRLAAPGPVGEDRAGTSRERGERLDDGVDVVGADERRPHALPRAPPQGTKLGHAPELGVPGEKPEEEGADLVDVPAVHDANEGPRVSRPNGGRDERSGRPSSSSTASTRNAAHWSVVMRS